MAPGDPIDYAALRVQLELRLRASRREVSHFSAADIELAERALDIGTRDLIHQAAVAFGLLEAAPAAEDAPAPAPGADGSAKTGPDGADTTKTDKTADPGNPGA